MMIYELQIRGTDRNIALHLQITQYYAEDVLPVFGSQCYFLCCCELGQQSEGNQQNQQAHQEGWLYPGGVAWFFGGGVREEDAMQIAEHHGQWLLLSPCCASHTHEHLQQQIVTTHFVHHRKSFLPVAVQLHNSSTSGRERDSRGMGFWGGPSLHFSSVLFCSAHFKPSLSLDYCLPLDYSHYITFWLTDSLTPWVQSLLCPFNLPLSLWITLCR